MKKYFFGILAVTIALGSVAFTTKSTPKIKTAAVWFVLKAGGNPDVPADYTSTIADPSSICEGTASVCAILAEDNTSVPGLQPRFDATLDAYLIQQIDLSQAGNTPDPDFVAEKN